MIEARFPARFDWQQSCVNNVAQEWAWNWHFLEPDFLNEHEERGSSTKSWKPIKLWDIRSPKTKFCHLDRQKAESFEKWIFV
eukprot:symbB.v1.2.022260.t1/scaffold1964.1/size94568/4